MLCWGSTQRFRAKLQCWGPTLRLLHENAVLRSDTAFLHENAVLRSNTAFLHNTAFARTTPYLLHENAVSQPWGGGLDIQATTGYPTNDLVLCLNPSGNFRKLLSSTQYDLSQSFKNGQNVSLDHKECLSCWHPKLYFCAWPDLNYSVCRSLDLWREHVLPPLFLQVFIFCRQHRPS